MTPRCIAAAAVTATLAACLSEPSYHPKVLVSYAEDGSGGTVTAPDFTLHFAGGSGFHFPDALTIDGTDLMGHDAHPACFDESATGFTIYPTPRISADSGAQADMNQLEPVLRGPAVAQVKVHWSTRLMCSQERAPGGVSTFTVFPDRRMFRHDVLSDPSDQEVDADRCACIPLAQAAFTVSSYWTFSRSAFSELFVFLGGAPLAQPIPSIGDDVSNFNPICLDRDDHAYQVVSTWSIPAGAEPPPTTSIHGGNMLIAHRLQKEIGTTNLELPWDIHTALFLERGGCMAAFRRASDYQQPQALTINGKPTTPSPLDGMYGGDSGDAQPGLDLGSAHATLTGTVAYPFAVWLRFSEAIEPRAKMPGATGAWYVPQQVDAHSWILWFRDPLAEGQKIEIGPP